ncbi:hypothetical protein K490DRAFT_71705 [Saccharata proteae CBS 121410]|uniref:S-adenosyl-L-methionine-dependent methyltransferase n=1 Tax=Saccharata proteae CBS 121410 TaxID=1314787 RepID=A0A9P4HVQ8_9PEZI|nr:hypothetical protein K490DRAFT_71705 [Saccharata proteae CBS 121410]
MATPQLPAEAHAVEVDDTFENDSAYSDDYQTFTTSLTSRVTDYKIHHGRRFHAYMEGKYPFPNDETEQNRLDLIHESMKLMLGGKLVLVPFKGEGRVLDLGTGTGIWAIEAGENWEAATILGNDLSPIQPRWTPPNVSFEVDDIEDLWAFPTTNTNNGGWVEMQDWDTTARCRDGSIRPDNNVAKYQSLCTEACEKIGRTANPGPALRHAMEAAGYKNVQERIFKLPSGLWPKDKTLKRMGAFNMLQYLEALEIGAFHLFVQALGWSMEEVQVFIAKVRQNAKDKNTYIYYDYYVVYGQKLD